MSELKDQIKAASEYISKFWEEQPVAGVILGSGLGGLVEDIEDPIEIPYKDIPHFPVSTVEGHSGKLILGFMNDKPIVAMAGRFHYYEGFSMKQVTFPVRVMNALGIKALFISNAAGGMNPDFSVGDLMIIRDHINLQPEHPLRGPNDNSLGPRFPDMSEPYNKDLIYRAVEIAAMNQIDLHSGVYVGVQGPTFETRAEYKYMHIIGGDAVGMSTVPEVIVAAHCGLKVFAMSVITDIGIREEENTITHEEVLEAAHAAEPKLTLIFSELIGQL
ncbi:purine-nucleoside phosphorylase [Chitinophaga jiangningensis]|uniref:Purine nucleoside phosphorylase n=1 Tax=Chitinophaga jiangningensis TaxID=1419482 RepID=A0A1M6VI74_9BACT|nr:purine-nucleoside phosphorylase [Chitinophaga jiangningensis]SHK81202.1 purine-nucleoside phosphorylase [Chitinophaga jiangningensis]